MTLARSTALAALIAVSLVVATASAGTYYISPSGSDASSGTSTQEPWRTFGFGIPMLQAGDTLVLMDGTYEEVARIDCNSGAANGTEAEPITISAQNERQAFLAGDGSDDTLS